MTHHQHQLDGDQALRQETSQLESCVPPATLPLPVFAPDGDSHRLRDEDGPSARTCDESSETLTPHDEVSQGSTSTAAWKSATSNSIVSPLSSQTMRQTVAQMFIPLPNHSNDVDPQEFTQSSVPGTPTENTAQPEMALNSPSQRGAIEVHHVPIANVVVASDDDAEIASRGIARHLQEVFSVSFAFRDTALGVASRMLHESADNRSQLLLAVQSLSEADAKLLAEKLLTAVFQHGDSVARIRRESEQCSSALSTVAPHLRGRHDARCEDDSKKMTSACGVPQRQLTGSSLLFIDEGEMSFLIHDSPPKRTSPSHHHELPKQLSVNSNLSACCTPLEECLRSGLLTAVSSTASLLCSHNVREYTGGMKEADDGTTTLCEYEIIAELGRGSYGTVLLGVNGDQDEPVAIKTMFKKTISKQVTMGSPSPSEGSFSTNTSSANFDAEVIASAAEREIALMKRLRHKNLVQLYAVIEDVEEQQCHLVMQYIENGPIAKLGHDGTCAPLPLDDVLHYMIQVSSALDYLHRHNIFHRDIKPENILIGKDRTAYVADFGVSSVMEESYDPSARQHSMGGTISYFSPELVNDHLAYLNYGRQCDAWAFGVTMYVLLYGELPFHGWSQPSLLRAILNDPIDLDKPTASGASAPVEVRKTLQGLLNRDPAKRLRLRPFRKRMEAYLAKAATETPSDPLERPLEFVPLDSLDPYDASTAEYPLSNESLAALPSGDAIILRDDEISASVQRTHVNFAAPRYGTLQRVFGWGTSPLDSLAHTPISSRPPTPESSPQSRWSNLPSIVNSRRGSSCRTGNYAGSCATVNSNLPSRRASRTPRGTSPLTPTSRGQFPTTGSASALLGSRHPADGAAPRSSALVSPQSSSASRYVQRLRSAAQSASGTQ